MRLGVVIACLWLLPAPSVAQQAEPRCTGSPPDPAWVVGSPVYRDCEVDRKAKQRSSDPDLDASILRGGGSDGRCLHVTLEFVVDSAGQPEPLTMRLLSTDSPGLAQGVRASLSKLRFTPARRDLHLVRQVVVYTRSVVSKASSPKLPPC